MGQVLPATVHRASGRSGRGDCPTTGERFLIFRFGDKLGDLNTITPDDIVAFLCKLKIGAHARVSKALPSHLRCLFNFLFWSGKTKRDLAASLPRVATAVERLRG
ncbi:MAG: hypothetical protein ACREQR_03260 [Candidatus Binataceae bacterium]